ncbi:MAG: hypothetical protein ACJ8CR_23530, partial [Roseiflexaceae bacterium]
AQTYNPDADPTLPALIDKYYPWLDYTGVLAEIKESLFGWRVDNAPNDAASRDNAALLAGSAAFGMGPGPGAICGENFGKGVPGTWLGPRTSGNPPLGTDVIPEPWSGRSGSNGELERRGRPVTPLERTIEYALNKESYLYAIANKYGIKLRGSGQEIRIMYDESMGSGTGRLGRTLESEGGRVIRIGPDALVDEGTAANTIAHELSHARDYLNGTHKPHGDASSMGNRTPYGSGNALEDYIRGGR